MFRLVAVVAALFAFIAPAPAIACTFCAGELRSKQTLRMHFAAAKAVLANAEAKVAPKLRENSTGTAPTVARLQLRPA